MYSKSKAIAITGREGLEGCETLRIPYAPAAPYSAEAFFSASGTHFCQRLSKAQGLVRPEGLDKLKKIH
jgi:hypothetical protein